MRLWCQQFSGVLKNCACRGGFNRYIDFEDAEFYRNPDHFDVKAWWVAAAVTAAFPVVLSFVVALPVWTSLRALWKDSETSVATDGGEEGVHLLHLSPKADMDWVVH